jgi:hypothetical protein
MGLIALLSLLCTMLVLCAATAGPSMWRYLTEVSLCHGCLTGEPSAADGTFHDILQGLLPANDEVLRLLAQQSMESIELIDSGFAHGSWPHQRLNSDCPRFVAAGSNPLGGLGHQLKNWHDGALIALLYNLTLAHQDFPNPNTTAHGAREFFQRWNSFLQWDQGEHRLQEVVRTHNLTIVDLPNQEDAGGAETWHLNPNMGIAYSDLSQFMRLHRDKCNVMFRQKQDQWSWHINRLKWASVAKYGKVAHPTRAILEFAPDVVNIAVHIRRGDVTKTNHTNKFQSNGWFKAVVSLICKSLPGLQKQVNIFSQAERSNFDDIVLSEDLAKTCGAPNGAAVRYIEDISDVETFDRFVNADILVLSESGLSKMAALLSPKALSFGPSTIVWEHPPPGMVMLDRRSGKVLNRQTAVAKIRAWKSSWARRGNQRVGTNNVEVSTTDVILTRHLFRLFLLAQCFDVRAGVTVEPEASAIVSFKLLLKRSGPLIRSYLQSKPLQERRDLLRQIFPNQADMVARTIHRLGNANAADEMEGCPVQGGEVGFGVHSQHHSLRLVEARSEL